MCVIIHSPAGVKFPVDYIEAAWNHNPHGAGFAYTDEKGNIVTVKGFMTLKHLMKRLKRHDIDGTDFTLHFRIMTSGQKDAANTHPWRIGDKVAVIHNGILHHIKAEKNISDTGVWTRDKVMPWYVSGSLQTEEFKAWAEKDIGSWNKVVIHNKGFKPLIINEKSGKWHEGSWYSNELFGGPFKKQYMFSYQDPTKKWCNIERKYVDKTPEEIEADKERKKNEVSCSVYSPVASRGHYASEYGRSYSMGYGLGDEDSAEWLSRWNDDLDKAVQRASSKPEEKKPEEDMSTGELEADIIETEALELREEQDDAEELITQFLCDENSISEEELFRLQSYLEEHEKYFPDWFSKEDYGSYHVAGSTVDWYMEQIDWAIWRKTGMDKKKSKEELEKETKKAELLRKIKENNNLKSDKEAEEFLENIDKEFLGEIENVDVDASADTTEPPEKKEEDKGFPMKAHEMIADFHKKYIRVEEDGYAIYVPREKVSKYVKPKDSEVKAVEQEIIKLPAELAVVN